MKREHVLSHQEIDRNHLGHRSREPDTNLVNAAAIAGKNVTTAERRTAVISYPGYKDLELDFSK